MDSWHSSRRVFLTHSALGFGGMALSTLLPKQLIAAHTHARQAKASNGPFMFFSPAEAADLAAFGAQVVPTDDTPGATQANVTYFIDHVLSEYEPGAQTPFREAIRELDRVTRRLFPKAGRFATLTVEQQMAVMTELEKTPTEPRADLTGAYFGLATSPFLLMRDYVVAGLLSEPGLGGNKNRVGWQLIGHDGEEVHEPPFGFYDAEVLKARKEPK